MMKIGICKMNPELLAETGCDYAELQFSKLAAMSEEDYQAIKQRHIELNIPICATNGLLPSDVILSEREELPDFGLTEFLETGYRRLSELGGKYAVIGSGRARNHAENESKQKGIERFARFVAFASDIARKFGIVNVVEELNSAETNIVLTVSDANEIVEMAGKPENLAIIADFYHIAKEDKVDSVKACADRILHCHIANPITRQVPVPNDGSEDYYKVIFSTLSEIGYNGGVSIEASAPNGAESYRESVEYLKKLAEEIK